MRSQEQLWLQCPLSSWSSSTSVVAGKQARWRAMALKRLFLYHTHSQPHTEGGRAPAYRAFEYRLVHGHPQAGFRLFGETFQQTAQFQVQDHGSGVQQQAQVLLQCEGVGHGTVQAKMQGGGLGYYKASAHQANLSVLGHGYSEALAEQQQHLEMKIRQHSKKIAQTRGPGYHESVAQQQGLEHEQVQGLQCERKPDQHQQPIHQVLGETLAHHQQIEEPVARRPLPKRLIPIPITCRSFSTNPVQNSVPIAESIQLTELEFKIFNTLKAFLLHYDLKTQLRVAGGWVRDKLLGRQSGDIDITLDDMLGKTFCRKLSDYCRMVGMQSGGFGVIKSNPTQAKHLEVAKMDILGVTVDFVNLRSHVYTESSLLPLTRQDFGTIVEDAYRRDFTINSLFYNITTEKVEDPTGKGLLDLRSGIIATPLAPKVTFTDDPLRALRALRFVATLDYDLHPDVKDAIDADIKCAFATKITRHRIGVEVDKILSCVNPLKAVELLVETELFPLVFGPPAEVRVFLPKGIESACLHALELVIDVVRHFGGSKLQAEDCKSLYLAAFLSPLRTVACEHNGKMVAVSTVVIKESLKLRSKDASMVVTLHRTAGNFACIRKLVCELDALDQGNGEEFITDLGLQAKHQIGELLEEMRGLWKLSLLLGAVFEEEEFLLSLPNDERKEEELRRRSQLCIFVEEALVRLGLDSMNGPHPYFYKKSVTQ